jgi:hypothetical protein
MKQNIVNDLLIFSNNKQDFSKVIIYQQSWRL